jgi:endo-1,4-beta-xylanase
MDRSLSNKNMRLSGYSAHIPSEFRTTCEQIYSVITSNPHYIQYGASSRIKSAGAVLATLVLLVLLLTACGAGNPAVLPATDTPEPTKVPTPTQKAFSTPTPDWASFTESTSLRELADGRHFQIGAAVAYEPLFNDERYAQVLAREFNLLTAENAMKFSDIHPAQDAYDFEKGDALVAFAEENGMQVRGHVLVWHKQLPEWLTAGVWSRQELMDILQNHITTVATHYRGKVSAWDVINEGLTDNGTLRQNIWAKGIGPEYIELAFQWAHEADPDALLFYNDYGAEGVGRKSMAVYDLVADLVANGVPIHGVGLQLHSELNTSLEPEELRLNIQQLADLGLVVHITEMDVRVRQFPSKADLMAQGSIYHDITQVCLEFDACQALVTWGFTDKYSWVPDQHKGFGSALPFDEAYQSKPAWQGIAAALVNE